MGKRNISKATVHLKHNRTDVVQLKKADKLDPASDLKPEVAQPKEEDRELKLVMPYRHRRTKTTEFLSKGQKKRLVKKAALFRRQELVSTMKSNGVGKNSGVSDYIKKEKQKKEIQDKRFVLSALNSELSNVINEVETEVKQKDLIDTRKQISNSRNKRCKLNRLIDEEKEKIMKVLNNKAFQQNPIEAMRSHIFNSQILEQRRQQESLNFNKLLKK